MKKVMLAVAMAACAGCAPKLINPNVTEAQAQADTQDCKYEASTATAAVNDEIVRAMRMSDLMTMCLQKRGYR